MKNHIKYLFILILFFQTTVTFSNDIPAKDTIKEVVHKQVSDIGLSEAEAYKLLYTNAKENNDRMINTLHWAIGLSIAFLIAIATGQFLFNYRINKKEIQYINKDLEETIAELKVELIKDMNEAKQKHEAENRETIAELEKDVKNIVEDKNKANREFINSLDKIQTIEREYLKKLIDNLTIDVEKNNGDIWLLKGVESNALSSFIDVALMKLKAKNDIKYNLDDILKLLDSIKEIHINDYHALDKLLEQLPEKYSSKKEKIQELYKKKPAYRYPYRGEGTGILRLTKEYLKNKPQNSGLPLSSLKLKGK